MKFIKNLLRYDTDKATGVAGFNNTTVLYKTENGNWFTYEEVTNDFRVKNEDEVVKLLEEYGRNDLLEEHFSDRIKDA